LRRSCQRHHGTTIGISSKAGEPTKAPAAAQQPERDGALSPVSCRKLYNLARKNRGYSIRLMAGLAICFAGASALF
jgi:hypothetical protein